MDSKIGNDRGNCASAKFVWVRNALKMGKKNLVMKGFMMKTLLPYSKNNFLTVTKEIPNIKYI